MSATELFSLPLSCSGLPLSCSCLPLSCSGLPLSCSCLPLSCSGLPLSCSVCHWAVLVCHWAVHCLPLSCSAMKDWRGASANVYGCKNVWIYCMYERKSIKYKRVASGHQTFIYLVISGVYGNPNCARTRTYGDIPCGGTEVYRKHACGIKLLGNTCWGANLCGTNNPWEHLCRGKTCRDQWCRKQTCADTIYQHICLPICDE